MTCSMADADMSAVGDVAGIGLGTAMDSLSAVKKFVYEDKILTLKSSNTCSIPTLKEEKICVSCLSGLPRRSETISKRWTRSRTADGSFLARVKRHSRKIRALGQLHHLPV